jgi:hypothetical protein
MKPCQEWKPFVETRIFYFREQKEKKKRRISASTQSNEA